MKKLSPYLALGLMLASPTILHAAETKVDFVGQIKPVLTNRCINCHHAGALFGNLSLENKDLAFKKRPTGPVIVPGQPHMSMLYLVLSLPKADQKAMPPTGHRIPEKEKELLRQWIAEGADWPLGSDGVIKPSVPSKNKDV